MAEGLSTYAANAILNALGNNTSLAVAQLYAQLHVGAPGASGTSNPATETTRKAVSVGAASAGSITNDAAVTWSPIAGSQDATHVSLWDASTSGNFIASGAITANDYTAGDTYTIDVGGIVISFSVAS